MAFKGKVDDVEITEIQPGSLLDELRNQKDDQEFEEAIPWIPAFEGDGLEGEVVGIGSYHDENFGNDRLYRTWIVKDVQGEEWAVIPFHRKLRKLMTMHRAEIGDKIGILYLGEKQSVTDPDATFKNYRVIRKAANRVRREAARAPRIMTPDAFGQKISVE